jgi:hypothetical protein
MAITYEPISTTTLGSAAANVTFSSISGSYTDLVLTVAKLTATASSPYLCFQFNSDTGTNYSSTILEGSGSSASSNRWTSETQIYTGYNVASGTTSDGMVITNFQDYSNATTYKTSLTRTAILNGSFPGTGAIVGLWRSTNAITSIKVFQNSGNLNSGCVFTLYGIKEA